MHHLILGYGYCAYFLAQELIKQGQTQISAFSRKDKPNYYLPDVKHQAQDLTQKFSWPEEETTLYYFIPPPSHAEKDYHLEAILKNPIKAKKVIYFGSSGVYGNHQGQSVSEESECLIQYPRQASRLDAEQQWMHYGKKNNCQITLLRIGGIYGPKRLPIEAAEKQSPLINREEAPLINSIYVRDLVRIALLLTKVNTNHQLWNIADGNPKPMGSLQATVAKLSQQPEAPSQSWEQAWATASEMKKEFLSSSKCLDIRRLLVHIPLFKFTPFEDAIRESLLNK